MYNSIHIQGAKSKPAAKKTKQASLTSFFKKS